MTLAWGIVGLGALWTATAGVFLARRPRLRRPGDLQRICSAALLLDNGERVTLDVAIRCHSMPELSQQRVTVAFFIPGTAQQFEFLPGQIIEVRIGDTHSVFRLDDNLSDGDHLLPGLS